ncbi:MULTISPECIES: DUF6691 family protein [unclassified Bradyrhizobium]|uniref:DUF6691 family protein n=1 Tax=unclassified Bradyrhizobium TaxID=2631580 RepID=UPI0028E7B4EA|nr:MULTISPECIES: DUF6691 family protein [unclassified Bradyrhizobium]
MTILIQFLVGLLFGLGLLLSGLSNPAKVLNFLDLAAIDKGAWDGSLIFVMIGAIAVTFTGFRLVLRRPRPILASSHLLPPRRGLDRRLVAGAAIFGVGWGLAGICPGPAFVDLGYGSAKAILFAIAMLVGMATARTLAARRVTAATPALSNGA